MLKALIIGGAGFVGGHLIKFLSSQGSLHIYATKLDRENIDVKEIDQRCIYNLDITDKKQVMEVIQQTMPDYIFHLAAQSSVSLSWKEPALTYNINVVGTINILEAVRLLNLDTRLLIIGSAEQYGAIKEEDLPIKEDIKIKPINPYAMSKASQEMIGRMYSEVFGINVIMVRAFNHIGPGQSSMFVISDFAKQIAEIEKGIREPIIQVGNLDVKRDFSDVRDIVRGYLHLVQNGVKGEIYNIGSGKSYAIRELLSYMAGISPKMIEVKLDPSKLRPMDIKELRADITKIREHTNWKPIIEIADTLNDIVNYWRKYI